ncbi:MAG: hypothetical protein ABWY01_03095 [Pseudoxanthomonas sp.]
MPEPFYFGDHPRVLFGLRHPAGATPRGAVLVCAPLLQEGIRCQRALWSLCQAVAARGLEALRFDWYGSGDSRGDSLDMSLSGLASDIQAAGECLPLPEATAPMRSSGPRLPGPRMLGLRSAALPLLLHAGACTRPVDLVLWAPALDGESLVSAWREQHRRQLHVTGRFPKPPLPAGENELLGFVVDDGLLEALQAWKGDQVTLPAGSRILLVQWRATPSTEDFVHRQRAGGVTVEYLQLDAGDEPDWDNPDQFETQIFPRSAVNRVASHLVETA